MKKLIIISLAFLISACSVMKTVQSFSKLKFKLDSVNGFTIGGMSISEKSSFSDFSALEILKLTSALTSGKLPVKFALNVAAINPNKDIAGLSSSVTVKSFPFTLMLNDKEAFKGDIKSPVAVPGGGKTEIFPVEVEFDMLRLIKDHGLKDIVNLVLQIGGKGGSPANLKVFARPVLGTPLGDFQYPGELKIVEKQFN